MYQITNMQKRAFVVAAITDVSSGTPIHHPVNIDPGTTEPVAEEHWDKLREGSRVIQALLDMRALIVNRSTDSGIILPDELKNTPSPVAADDLKPVLGEADANGVTTTSKTEVVEVNLEPVAEARPPRRKA